MFYKMQYNYAFDLKISNMKLTAKKLSSKIIIQHMRGIKPKKADFSVQSNYKIILLGLKNDTIVGKMPKGLSLNKDINIVNKTIYLVDHSTYGHLGIYKIIVIDDKFLKNHKLLYKTILIFSLIYIVILFIGYFLAKLFLKPIVTQRIKLDTFIKDTTHELNTPVSAIVMSINSNKITPKTIQRIKISAKRVSEIYSDLTYLFLEQNKELNPLSKINLKTVLQEQMEYFLFLASKKRIEVISKIDNVSLAIKKEDFLRIANNLISNAIKYTNKGGRIEIILKKDKFIVKDTGQGIPKTKQKEIFDRFTRATNVIGGFGIGLNIVQNIAHKYNFKIDLLSCEKRGTTFTIFF